MRNLKNVQGTKVLSSSMLKLVFGGKPKPKSFDDIYNNGDLNYVHCTPSRIEACERIGKVCNNDAQMCR